MELNPHLHPDAEVYEQPDTASACNLIEALLNENFKVRVARPLAENGTAPYRGGSERGEEYGSIAAICALDTVHESWELKGVFQWLEDDQDLDWQGWNIENMLII